VPSRPQSFTAALLEWWRHGRGGAPAEPYGEFAGGPLTDDVSQLGFIAIDLAASFPQWVRRRKTSFRFLDERTVQLRRSVDLVLPDIAWFAGTPPRPGQTIYIPLDIFKKETLAGFSVSDQDGRPVSILNTHENGTLSTAGFSALIDRNAAPQERDSFRATIQGIVFAATEAAGQRAYQTGINRGLHDVLPAGTQYEALLEDLQRGFLLLVPVTYEPDANHIFKIDWSAPYTWSKPGFGGTLRSAAASLGLVDKELDFTELPIGFAHGTHFEFHAPESVRNLETVLDVDQHDPSRGRVRLPRRRVVYSKPQANVNVSVRNTRDLVECRSDLAAVTVKLRPRRGGTFLAIVVVAWLVALVLAAIASRLGQLDAQTSVAVVLVLPAVLAAYLAREGEHAIASRLRAGVRFFGLVIAAIAFAAAIIIGVGQLREPGRSPPMTINCSATNQSIGTPRRPAPQLERLDCMVPPVAAPVGMTNDGLQSAVWWLAAGSAFVALLLSGGLWATHRATRAAARRDDENNPDP
jgi:hypothetical protein